jgi:hypothetical protein
MTLEDPMRSYLKSLISEELKKKEFELKESDAQQIVQAIMPEIDKLVTKRVKEHFIELAHFINAKFTD